MFALLLKVINVWFAYVNRGFIELSILRMQKEIITVLKVYKVYQENDK